MHNIIAILRRRHDRVGSIRASSSEGMGAETPRSHLLVPRRDPAHPRGLVPQQKDADFPLSNNDRFPKHREALVRAGK